MHALEDFRALLGERFQAGPVELVLTTAESSGAAPAPGLPAPFRLVFTGPATPALEQATHRLTHAGTEFEIFLVPVGPAVYEAIFS